MCPQKWYASAAWARSVAVTNSPPATASSKRPTPARNPRRELASTTASLKPCSDRRCLRCPARRRCEQAFQLDQRVERPLGQDLAGGPERDAVGAARDRECAPDVRIALLVEDLELDCGVIGDQTNRRLERLAERTAGGA